ncbi:hypothetical protein CPB86DRAFT_76391 [Serendipita vermifera]|nr:hypothetical protein CPB86DRAFT_76391 [Serendipita vermifera]
MIFKNSIYTFTLLLTSAVVVVQVGGCVNQACIAANNQYQDYLTNYSDNLKPCLCTQKFLINYDCCLRGKICAWNGSSSSQLCPAVYCPGTFDGGFDAKFFCGVTTTSAPVPGET